MTVRLTLTCGHQLTRPQTDVPRTPTGRLGSAICGHCKALRRILVAHHSTDGPTR